MSTAIPLSSPAHLYHRGAFQPDCGAALGREKSGGDPVIQYRPTSGLQPTP